MSDLLLVGGGHSHVEIVRRWGSAPPPGWRLTVVSRDLRPVYSGMVPGFVAGLYRAEELEIDLPDLCGRSGATLRHASVVRIDAQARRARLASGELLSWDLASIDVGSTVAGRDQPGVADHALVSRPIADLIRDVDTALDSLRAAGRRRGRLVVVGTGAAGIELAFCMRERLLRRGLDVEVTLLDAGDRMLPDASDSLRRRVGRALRRREIRLALGRHVAAVEPDAVRIEGDGRIEADLVVWATGPAALPLARDSGLPVDERGFLPVHSTLAVRGQRSLFATGDCAALPGMRRAGVYAVRAAPVLDHNLRATIEGGPLREYRPQRHFLSLLTLGDGRAIGAKWGFSFEGRWVMRLKDRIDRGFMARYSG